GGQGLALQQLQLGIGARLGQHRDQLVGDRDLGRVALRAGGGDERARGRHAHPVLQETPYRVRRALWHICVLRGEQLVAEQLLQIVGRQAAAFESARGSS